MSSPSTAAILLETPPSDLLGQPHLPLELIGACLEFLHDDFQTLRECLFVGRATLHVCRKHLFRVVVVIVSALWSDIKAFYAFWQSSKHLLLHVKDLTFDGPSLRKYGGLLDLFSGAQLETFRYYVDNNTLASSSVDLALMRSFLCDSRSTLVEIHLTRVHRFPADMLAEFRNLEKLCFYPKTPINTIGSHHNEEFEEDITKLPQENSIPLTELVIVEYMTPETWFDLHYCIDATALRKLKVIHRSAAGFEPLQAFLEKVAQHIEHLIFRPSLPILDSTIRTSPLDLLLFRNLRQLEFRISYSDVDLAFLRWIYEHLRVLPRANPIQELVINAPSIWLQTDHTCDRTPEGECRASGLPIVDCLSGQLELMRILCKLDGVLAGFSGLNEVQVFCENLGLDDVFPALAALGRLVVPFMDPYHEEAIEELLDDEANDEEADWDESDSEDISLESLIGGDESEDF
ncbi:hypothetical protein BDN72DRAFT_876251 [Pluteus cervinus]|uniref:Uncharacterized protein n=1 Tax=Pluteus cervinus TaxID=181527 RepID=A0ACD3B5F7_9AGAR|nr:hypothetical protein BDN72DRAFT_876251 [Pluteus cervinus]